MKLFITLLVIALVNTKSYAAQNTSALIKDVTKAVNSFALYFSTADSEKLEAMLTKNYLHINGSSGTVINKNQWLSWLKTRKADIEEGRYKINSYRLESLEVKIYNNNLAIVTGIAVNKGTNNDQPFDSKIRFSNTWVLLDEQWRRALFHDTTLNQ